MTIWIYFVTTVVNIGFCRSTTTIDGIEVDKTYCPMIDEEKFNLKLLQTENDIRDMVIEQIDAITVKEEEYKKKLDTLHRE